MKNIIIVVDLIYFKAKLCGIDFSFDFIMIFLQLKQGAMKMLNVLWIKKGKKISFQTFLMDFEISIILAQNVKGRLIFHLFLPK